MINSSFTQASQSMTNLTALNTAPRQMLIMAFSQQCPSTEEKQLKALTHEEENHTLDQVLS